MSSKNLETGPEDHQENIQANAITSIKDTNTTVKAVKNLRNPSKE